MDNITVAFFDAKPYDKESFESISHDNIKYRFLDSRLTAETAYQAQGCKCVCAFVNDDINSEAIAILNDMGVKLIAMRCAGYNNIDFKAAYGSIHVVRVPNYSPYSVAEHTAALMLTLNRKIHKAYNRTRDFNFSLNGLIGFDLHGKTAGVIGTGKIGQCFIDICRGFGMDILAYDPYPADISGVKYCELEHLYGNADIISLHCPLTDENRYMINSSAFEQMKKGVILINTSRGSLIDSTALLQALKDKKVAGAGLDVYEEESELFFEDNSDTVIQDDILSLLVSMPNVIVTSHQAFLTEEALDAIAKASIKNITDFFNGSPLKNEICYNSKKGCVTEKCEKNKNGRCF